MQKGGNRLYSCTNRFADELAQNKDGVQQGGNAVGVALSFTFFGERHCAGQEEADLCRNENKYLS